MFFRSCRILVLSLTALLCASSVSAQTAGADVSGTVNDPSGAPVAGSKVTATNQDTGATRSIDTDPEGRYQFALLAGRYSLTAEANGFKKETLTKLELTVGQRLNQNIALTVGSVQDAVTVTADVPPVDTTKGEVS